MTTAAQDAAHSARPRIDLDPAAHTPIERQRARRSARLARRERLATLTIGGTFVAAAALLALVLPSARSPGLLVYALLPLAYAAAYRLDFEVATGSAVPTQLLLVPMLFVLPAGQVPVVVGLAIVLANLVDCVQGGIRFSRVFVRVTDGWHAVGPALVLGLAAEGNPTLARWPLYAGALAAQFAFDFVSASAHQWLALRVPPRAQLRAMASVYLIDAALAPVGLAVALATVGTPYAFVLALPLIALLAVFARERRSRIDHALELGNAYRGTALLLGDVVEADDAYTGSHSRDVVGLVTRVAGELGLDERARRDAEFAALLHDVGKVRIPNEIINKPGKLTDEERAVMNTHTIEGQVMLERVGGLLGEVGRIVRSCHERYDGHGYPDGLAGERIPLIARIVACCDAFSAMTTTRPYRSALSEDAAVAELERNRGTQFDPAVVDAVLKVLGVPARGIAAPSPAAR